MPPSIATDVHSRCDLVTQPHLTWRAGSDIGMAVACTIRGLLRVDVPELCCFPCTNVNLPVQAFRAISGPQYYTMGSDWRGCE